MEIVQTTCKWWPMAKLEDGTIIHTDYPARSPKNCTEIVKCWDEETFIEEAWIDITVGDDPEPVKRIPLKREWKLGKSIILKEEEHAGQ